MSWPSRNKGNSVGLEFADVVIEFTANSADVDSTEGAWSWIYEREPPNRNG